MKKLTLIYILIYSGFCLAEDDCVRNTPESIGKAEHSLVESYNLSTNNDGHLVEEIKLKSGQGLYISQYGCAHFGLEYKFKLEKAFDGNLIIQARKYLALVGEFAPMFTLSLSKALDEVADNFATPEEITLTPGYDWIYLGAKSESNEHYFIISYDIAL